ncbi:hypothetical protein FACS189452_04770 [Bacteroidia bacterium]|nr:hypothetical protein FACS189452_04770 [Bacteroidia bacterium]
MENTENKSSKSHTGYVIAIALLVIIVAILAGVYRRQYNKLEAINIQMEAERDTLNDKLIRMLGDYDSVKTTNEEMKAEVEEEKKKIRMLIRKLYITEQFNLENIRKYESELTTMRSIMRNYLVQIDSLNTLSQRLISENQNVKQSLREYKEENQALANRKTTLEQQVEKAAMLKISTILAEGLNSRDKDTERVSRIKKLKGCFTINENVTAATGVRTVYMCITNPLDVLLENTTSGTVELQGTEMRYSAKREIDYQGEALETCVYFDTQDAKLFRGKYTMQIFIDSDEMGTTEFTLK